MPTPSEILPIAAVCQFLAANDEVKKSGLQGGYIRPSLSRLIYIVRSSVSWLNTYNSSDDTLVGKANYLYSLCQPYVGQAQVILNSGGSGTIVNPATSVASTIGEIVFQFTVGETTSPQIVNGVPVDVPNAGDTIITLPLTFILNNSIDVYLDEQKLPIADSNQRSVTVAYSNSQAIITINQAFANDEQYQVRGRQFIATSLPTPAPQTRPDPYDFEVSPTSFIPDGATTKTISAFAEFNLLFIRNGVPQGTVDLGGNYFSWDKDTAVLNILGGAVATGEQIQLYAI